MDQIFKIKINKIRKIYNIINYNKIIKNYNHNLLIINYNKILKKNNHNLFIIVIKILKIPKIQKAINKIFLFNNKQIRKKF